MSTSALSDRVEIEDCLARYAAAVDRHDWDLLDTVFLPDAPCDYSEIAPFKGTATELKAWLASHMPPSGIYYHLMGTARVTLEGDTAQVVTACLNPMPIGAGAMSLLGHWYRDSMVRTDDGTVPSGDEHPGRGRRRRGPQRVVRHRRPGLRPSRRGHHRHGRPCPLLRYLVSP